MQDIAHRTLAPVQALADAPPSLDPVPDPPEPMQAVSRSFARGEREKPPTRQRGGETIAISISGMTYRYTVNRYDDGRPSEVVITTGKTGSALLNLYTTIGILISHYLQIGGDVHTISAALKNVQFQPAGPVPGAPAGIEKVTSPVDALAQLLVALEDEREGAL